MGSDIECQAIRELDLEPIMVKLMDKKSGEGWSLDRACAAEAEYRRFWFLIKNFPTEPAAPLGDVDTVWHYHILDTMKYARDCQTVFGYFLHHFPYAGLRGADDLAAHERLGERTRALHEKTFGRRYGTELTPLALPDPALERREAAFCAAPATQAIAFCAAPAAPELAFCAAPATPQLAFCAAPASPLGAADTSRHGHMDEFFSRRPTLTSHPAT